MSGINLAVELKILRMPLLRIRIGRSRRIGLSENLIASKHQAHHKEEFSGHDVTNKNRCCNHLTETGSLTQFPKRLSRSKCFVTHISPTVAVRLPQVPVR